MSQAEIALCATCLERPVRWGDECVTCSLYRKRTGNQRPTVVIVANNERRARGQGFVGGSELQTWRRTTLRHVGASAPGVEVCAPCGTVTSWARGVPMPLCKAHLGSLALLTTIWDKPGERERILEALTV